VDIVVGEILSVSRFAHVLVESTKHGYGVQKGRPQLKPYALYTIL
jgi:hypothetical protein